MRADKADTTLRWLITNKWGDPDQQAEALQLIDRIIGYPAPGEEAPLSGPKQQTIQNPETGFSGLRFALVVGHNAKAPGAWVQKPINESEFVFNNNVANLVIERGVPGVEIRRFNRVYSGSYSREIDTVYRAVNAWAPHAVAEMHFNGGGGNYTTMLAANTSTRAQALAQAFQDTFVEFLGFADKGLMKLGRSSRGGRSLFAAKAPLVLTEPFFGDSAAHSRAVAEIGHSGIADIYRLAIVEGLAALGHGNSKEGAA